MIKIYVLFFLFLISYLNSNSQKYNWNRVFYQDMSENDFVGIDNYDSLNIMAVEVLSTSPPPGYNRIVKSTDGGITWDTVYKDLIFKDSLIQAVSISYHTKDFCVVGTHKNYIIKTTDGGKNWTSKKIDIKNYAGLYEIMMLDDKNGVTYDYRNMVITHDGFESYKVVPPPMYGNFRHAKLLSPTEIYVIYWDVLKPHGDTNHIIFRTKDEGVTWEKVGALVHPYFWSQKMKFIDKDFGYLVGDMQVAIGMLVSNVIYRTMDGGDSWQKVLDTIVPWNAWGIQEIDILDRKTAIATSQFGVVFWTHDGGDSWQLDSSEVLREDKPATLYPCILGEHTALIADSRDRITRSSLKPTDIKEEEYFKSTGEMIYPNPATDYITINSPSIKRGQGGVLELNNVKTIEIYDVMGMKIHSTPVETISYAEHSFHELSLQKIDISYLSPGIYFVKICGSNGACSILGKFVKM